MKSKYSNETLAQQNNQKSFIRKHKSPATIKQKNKNQKDLLSFLGIHKNKITKKKEQMLKYQQKIDSNNTTANCTYSRSKIIKSSTLKNIERQSTQLKRNKQQISQQEVLMIINNFAAKIQKQWRVYILRQRFKELIQSIHQNKNKNQIFKNQGLKGIQKSLEQKSINIKKAPYVLFEENGELISSYDLYKYEQHQANLNNSKQSSIEPVSQRSNSNISIKYHQNSAEISKKQKILKKIASQKNYHEPSKNVKQKMIKQIKQVNDDASIRNLKSKSLQIRIEVDQKIVQQKELKQNEQKRSSFDIFQQQSINLGLNKRHSAQIKLLNNPKKQSKPLQIDKVIQIEIKTQKKLQNDEETTKFSSQKLTKLSRLENERNTFNSKFPLQKILKKRKKDIEVSKLKKLLSIENRYNKNEMTYRSYLEVVKKINDDHEHRIKQFKEREGLIISNWVQIVDIGKPNKSTKFLEDQIDNNNSIVVPDVTMSFDRWDFNSSAKKSIDQPLDFSENFGHTSKIISFQSVLKQLQEQQKKEEAQQKMFKKIKSNVNVVVQAIPERSKQISQKDLSQFSGQQYGQHKVKSVLSCQDQSSHHNDKYEQAKNINKNENDTYKQQQINNKQSSELLITPNTPKILHSIGFQNDNAAKDNIQVKVNSQSLVVSQIEAVQYNQYLFSDKSCCLSDQKLHMNELIFKDFKLNTQNKQEKQTAEERYERVLQQFIDLASQKFVLNNIKIINSVKFLFGRVVQERKLKAQAAKVVQSLNYPKMDATLNNINVWLLEISHFMLDNFQKILRDNLIIIKQPPALQILQLCKKNIPYTNIYQAIPQYIYKDFQFFFIKNSADFNLVQAPKFETFSDLMYTFHRCLIDCLNISLTQELITGKNWLQLPWRNDFKKKKKIEHEHAKSCLQRSINTVSNWAEYGLGKLSFEDETAQYEYKYYESQRLSLVCREEVNQYVLCPMFTQANMLLQISQEIYEAQLNLFILQFKQMQNL